MGNEPKNLIDRLDEEWERPQVRRRMDAAIQRWSRSEPDLSFTSCRELEQHLSDRAVPYFVHDRVLAALIRMADRDPLAARLVLQRFLPSLKRTTGAHPPLEDYEWVGLLVAIAYEEIRSYPLDRWPHDIAVRLTRSIRRTAYKALDRLRRDRAELCDDPLTPRDLSEDPRHHTPGGFHHIEVVDLMRWAVRESLLDPSTARLIELTRIQGRTVASLADRFRESAATLRQRRRRAEARLAAALTAEVG